MNIGEKIKRIRQHRRMTQKELGELVDLSANRIAQYEMGYRVPKKPLLNQIAEALRVSPLALSDGGNGPANDILEQLFWLDEEQPGVIKLVPTERGIARYAEARRVKLIDNEFENLKCFFPWWLRSSGYPAYRAAGVSKDGKILARGRKVTNTSYFVRPALRVYL